MLPPGVNSKDFSDALKQFEAAVGKEWVFTSDEDVALYRDAYSPFWGEPEERVASAAVAPGKVEDVQAVMKIANEYKIPVYPISTGKNLGYGGSAPNLSGSVAHTNPGRQQPQYESPTYAQSWEALSRLQPRFLRVA